MIRFICIGLILGLTNCSSNLEKGKSQLGVKVIEVGPQKLYLIREVRGLNYDVTKVSVSKDVCAVIRDSSAISLNPDIAFYYRVINDSLYAYTTSEEIKDKWEKMAFPFSSNIKYLSAIDHVAFKRSIQNVEFEAIEVPIDENLNCENK